MQYLLILVVITNVLALSFFFSLYIKRIKIDNDKKAADQYKSGRYAEHYLSV